MSGLEMSQNSMRLSWSREEVDEKLQARSRASLVPLSSPFAPALAAHCRWPRYRTGRGHLMCLCCSQASVRQRKLTGGTRGCRAS